MYACEYTTFLDTRDNYTIERIKFPQCTIGNLPTRYVLISVPSERKFIESHWNCGDLQILLLEHCDGIRNSSIVPFDIDW